MTSPSVGYANGKLWIGVLVGQIGQKEIIRWRYRWSDLPMEDHALGHMRIRSAGELLFRRPSVSDPPMEEYSSALLSVRSANGRLLIYADSCP